MHCKNLFTMSGAPFLRAAAIIGGVNAFGFLCTTQLKSEVITDLLGTGSIGISAAAIAMSNGVSSPQTLLSAGAIGVWSSRLSVFLAYRAFLYGDDRLKAFLPRNGGPWSENLDRLRALGNKSNGKT
jgi:steroid 5-alpha reductase family enzyme